MKKKLQYELSETKPTCFKCYKNKDSVPKPACHYKPCEYSELASPELQPWLNFFRALRSDFISKSGMTGSILRRAKATSNDVLELFLVLEGVIAEEQEKRRQNNK